MGKASRVEADLSQRTVYPHSSKGFQSYRQMKASFLNEQTFLPDLPSRQLGANRISSVHTLNQSALQRTKNLHIQCELLVALTVS